MKRYRYRRCPGADQGWNVQGGVQDKGKIARIVELEVKKQTGVTGAEQALTPAMDRIRLNDLIDDGPETVMIEAVAQIIHARPEGNAERFARARGVSGFAGIFAGAYEFRRCSDAFATDAFLLRTRSPRRVW